MAEAKKPTEKPRRQRLHDEPKSSETELAPKTMKAPADAKKPAKPSLYSAPEEAGEAPGGAPQDMPGAAPVAAPAPAAEGIPARQGKAREDMFKRHEAERKEAGRNHLESLRKMHDRHEKEYSKIAAEHAAEMTAGADAGEAQIKTEG